MVVSHSLPVNCVMIYCCECVSEHCECMYTVHVLANNAQLLSTVSARTFYCTDICLDNQIKQDCRFSTVVDLLYLWGVVVSIWSTHRPRWGDRTGLAVSIRRPQSWLLQPAGQRTHNHFRLTASGCANSENSHSSTNLRPPQCPKALYYYHSGPATDCTPVHVHISKHEKRNIFTTCVVSVLLGSLRAIHPHLCSSFLRLTHTALW